VAQIYGRPGKEHGDQLLYKALHSLPDECIVYAQPALVHKRTHRYPDYVVVHAEWGLAVLEVKDWLQVEKCDRQSAWVRRSDTKSLEREHSPVTQSQVCLGPRLISDLEAMGTETDWEEASFSAKLPDPGGSGRRLTLLLVNKYGEA
jgi:hypothetical protein